MVQPRSKIGLNVSAQMAQPEGCEEEAGLVGEHSLFCLLNLRLGRMRSHRTRVTSVRLKGRSPQIRGTLMRFLCHF